jgi:hypothetical protein
MQDPIEAMRSGLRREPTDQNMENLEWLDGMLPPRKLLDGLLAPREKPAGPVEADFPIIPGQPRQVAHPPRPAPPKPVKSVLKR